MTGTRVTARFFRERQQALIEWARCQFELDKIPTGSKQSVRQQLEQVYKTTGVMPPQLDTGEPPEGLAYLYHYYLELRGSEPLTYTEISNWSQLTRRNLAAWEVSVIRALDICYWNVRYADQ